MVLSVSQRFTGMKRMALERKISSSRGSSKRIDPIERQARSRYVLCVKNRGYAASLERRKIYRRLNDLRASRHGLIRVVDESGQDYLYPSSYFVSIAVPKPARRALSHAR
jgi:hypothetical protein